MAAPERVPVHDALPSDQLWATPRADPTSSRFVSPLNTTRNLLGFSRGLGFLFVIVYVGYIWCLVVVGARLLDDCDEKA